MQPSSTDARRENKLAFKEKYASSRCKVQIGARGRKIGKDWIALDRFDFGELIDFHWDLQCLPIADEVVDCFVCNAVLEHLPYPDLAVHEMWRTLKIGGGVWVEVPFFQHFHADMDNNFFDYYRWTDQGLKMLFEDFAVINIDVANGIAYEVRKIGGHVASVIGESFDAGARRRLEEKLALYEKKSERPFMYSSLFIWAEKKTPIDPEKSRYYHHRRARYADRQSRDLGYDPAMRRTAEDMIERARRD